MDFPDSVRYSPLHCWARFDGGTVVMGITDFAQHELGELQYVGLPRVGSSTAADAALGEVESSKTASDVYSPCSGSVIAVNQKVLADPTIVNRDPFGDGWLVRIQPTNVSEFERLTGPAEYREAVEAGAD
jgi:glycine cleavage system H protein